MTNGRPPQVLRGQSPSPASRRDTVFGSHAQNVAPTHVARLQAASGGVAADWGLAPDPPPPPPHPSLPSPAPPRCCGHVPDRRSRSSSRSSRCDAHTVPARGAAPDTRRFARAAHSARRRRPVPAPTAAFARCNIPVLKSPRCTAYLQPTATLKSTSTSARRGSGLRRVPAAARADRALRRQTARRRGFSQRFSCSGAARDPQSTASKRACAYPPPPSPAAAAASPGWPAPPLPHPAQWPCAALDATKERHSRPPPPPPPPPAPQESLLPRPATAPPL
eukprot:160041-Chlamydomonas_euryale.AAC.5